MRTIRITTKHKPILSYLKDAWIKPLEQDVPTENIIKWLRLNIHRPDVGLWVTIDNGEIIGCLIAFGPTLLNPSVHIYCGWVKTGCEVDTQSFFEGPFSEWVKGLGCDEITINSAGHSSRSWQRRFGFMPYSRVYRRSLEPTELGLANSMFNLKDIEK